MKDFRFLMCSVFFFSSLLFSANTLIAQEGFVADDWQWELHDVLHGHASQSSEIAASTNYLSVTPNVSKSGSGSVRVISILQHDTGTEVIPCQETYTFEWNLTGYRVVALDNGFVSARVTASAISDLPDICQQCDGSNDGTIEAHGSSGVFVPPFFPEEYVSSYGTELTTGKAWGFSDFYPNSEEGIIGFPFWYGPNYPVYAYFFVSIGVPNAKAEGILEYSVAYVYKRVQKNAQEDYFNSLPGVNMLLLEGGPSGAVD